VVDLLFDSPNGTSLLAGSPSLIEKSEACQGFGHTFEEKAVQKASLRSVHDDKAELQMRGKGT
jgi:hypothetical protein